MDPLRSRDGCRRPIVVNRRMASPTPPPGPPPSPGLPWYCVRPPPAPHAPPQAWFAPRWPPGSGSSPTYRPASPQCRALAPLPPRPAPRSLASCQWPRGREQESQHGEVPVPVPWVPTWRRQQQQQQQGVDVNQLPPFGVRTAVAAAATARASLRPTAHSDCSSASSPTDSCSLTPPDTSANIGDLISFTQELCLQDLKWEQDSSVVQSTNFHPQTFTPQTTEFVQSLISPVHSDINALRRTINKNHVICAFCKGNGESPSLFTSHVLHQRYPDGRVIVTCPVLRKLRCEVCGATGDNAHTRSHCSLNKQPSIATLLKRTPRRCDGRLRKPMND